MPLIRRWNSKFWLLLSVQNIMYGALCYDYERYDNYWNCLYTPTYQRYNIMISWWIPLCLYKFNDNYILVSIYLPINPKGGGVGPRGLQKNVNNSWCFRSVSEITAILNFFGRVVPPMRVILKIKWSWKLTILTKSCVSAFFFFLIVHFYKKKSIQIFC